MNKFNFTNTKIIGVTIVESVKFTDNRGYFMETYNENTFKENGIVCKFVQDNQSKSSEGVLRGLHFQKCHSQAKLIGGLSGEIYDVAVDLRSKSSTYGQWVGVNLSENNGKQLFIPKGFAHGFLVLSKEAIISYKCDDFYYPEEEGGIIWNDPDIAIKWPDKKNITLSEKDKLHPFIRDKKIFFEV